MDENNVHPLPPIVWIEEQFADSNIKHRVDLADMSLTLGPPRGMRINYYDIKGDIVPNFYKVRVYPPDMSKDDEKTGYGEAGYRKYWQPKGLYQRLYWPRVLGVDHLANMGDISVPLFLVEGEKKALSLQSKLMELGIRGSVAGLPGVVHSQDILKELSTLTWKGKIKNQEFRRPTWLVYDHNDKGPAEAETRKGESLMLSHLARLNADIMALRWACQPDDGVQKIDDWLTKGGDLPLALEESAEGDFLGGDELTQFLLKINEDWGLYNGEYVMVTGTSRGARLNRTKFLDMNATYQVLVPAANGKLKKMPAALFWIEWPGRRVIDGFVNVPPPLGLPPQEWIDNNMNISEGWSPTEEIPWAVPETKLIDTLLENFCQGTEHYIWLRQHVAKMLLNPTETTSQAVILCGKPGTGKTMLMDSFKLLASKDMIGRLARNISLEKMDRFNSALAGTVIGLVEEPPKVQKGKDFESLVKLIVGAKTFEMESKGKDPIMLPSHIHLWVAMNLRYLSHLPPEDRRCNFYEGKKQIGEKGTGFAVQYAKFMEGPEFASIWLQWAKGISLEGYSPQLLGPVSAARLNAIAYSANQEEDFFSELGGNVITNADLWQQWSVAYPRSQISQRKLALMAQDSGWSKAQDVWINGKNQKTRARLSWLLENPDTDWGKEYKNTKF